MTAAFTTVTGRRLDLAYPVPEDVDLRDIACGLSKLCRFTGQLSEFYSVAQHSCFVARVAEPRLRKAALLHDASEAYLNDLPRNLKHSQYLAGYRAIEDRWSHALRSAFRYSLNREDERRLKMADDLAAVWERVVLRQHRSWAAHGVDEIFAACSEGWVRHDPEELVGLLGRVPVDWTALDPRQAEARFLEDFRCYDLSGYLS